MSEYYVYILFRRDGVTPFYVGKGKGKRWSEHLSKAKAGRSYKDNIILQMKKDRIKIPRSKIATDLNEFEAIDIEIKTIASIGRYDLGNGPLTNLTNGGDGVAGWVPSTATREKQRQSNLGKSRSVEARENMRLAKLGIKRGPQSPAHRSAIGAYHRGKKMSAESRQKMRESQLGKKHSKETLMKMSASRIGIKLSSESRAKLSAWRLGKKLSPEHREKLRVSKLGKKLSPDHCAAQRAGRLRAKLRKALEDGEYSNCIC